MRRVRLGLREDELRALAAHLEVGLRELGADRSRTAADPRPARWLLESIAAELRETRASDTGNARVCSDDAPELLTIPEAARHAGVPASTVREWLAKRWVRPVGRRGGRLWMTAEAVAEVDDQRRSRG